MCCCLFVCLIGIYPAWYSLNFLNLWFDVINFGKLSTIISSNISSIHVSLSSFRHSNNAYKQFGFIPQFLDILVVVIFLYLLFFCFSLGNFYWHLFKFTNPFLGYVQSTTSPYRAVFSFALSTLSVCQASNPPNDKVFRLRAGWPVCFPLSVPPSAFTLPFILYYREGLHIAALPPVAHYLFYFMLVHVVKGVG